MDLNRYKLDNTYVRAIVLLWADGVPWPSGARDRVPGAPTQARFSQLGSRHSVADGHAVLPIAPVLVLSSGRYRRSRIASKLPGDSTNNHTHYREVLGGNANGTVP